MPEKTRVLVYTTAFRPFIGGSEIALEEMIRHLQSSSAATHARKPLREPNIFFDIFTPRCRRTLSPKEHSGNFSLHRIGLGFSGDKYLFPAAGFLSSLGVLKQVKIIHSYQASFGGMAAFMAKLFFPGKKLIVTLQEGKDLDRQNLLKRTVRDLILKKADVITAISSYLKNYAVSVNKRAEIVVIPNGVDLEKFKNDGSLRNKHTLITVSRLVKKNGIEYLIRAMEKVIKKIPDARLLIVGDGEGEICLRDIKSELALGESVEFLGELAYQDIPEYLAGASVFVRPSLSEGLGNSFLEAMAAGLAVIGTPVGGIPDFLKDGETGLFCRPGDPESIADKIIMLLENDELRNKLADNGRRLVEEKYTWKHVASEFEKLYARI